MTMDGHGHDQYQTIKEKSKYLSIKRVASFFEMQLFSKGIEDLNHQVNAQLITCGSENPADIFIHINVKDLQPISLHYTYTFNCLCQLKFQSVLYFTKTTPQTDRLSQHNTTS